MIRWGVHLALFSMGIALCACLDKIALEAPDSVSDSLAFDARLIVSDTSTFTLRAERLFTFGGQRGPVALKQVVLLNDLGQSLQVPSEGLGRYRIDVASGDDFQIGFDRNYHVYVASVDGREFESSIEGVLPVPKADSLTFVVFCQEIQTFDGEIVEEDFIGFEINTPILAGVEQIPVNMKWRLDRVYKLTDSPAFVEPKTCFLTETPDIINIDLFDASVTDGQPIVRKRLYDAQVRFTFAEGLYLNVYQESLTETAFDYWDQVRLVANRNGNMFENAPGRVISNFRNIDRPTDQVFGYFYATQIDTVRVYVSPEEAGNPRPFCPPIKPVPLIQCADCLTPLNALNASTTLEQPEWWVE